MVLNRKDHVQFIDSTIGDDLLPMLKELKRIRAIWEHDFEHLDGNGNYQKEFVRPTDLSQVGLAEDQPFAVIQIYVDSGKLCIGKRLDFELIVEAVKSFDDRLHALFPR